MGWGRRCGLRVGWVGEVGGGKAAWVVAISKSVGCCQQERPAGHREIQIREGRMSEASPDKIMEAVREAGATHLVMGSKEGDEGCRQRGELSGEEGEGVAARRQPTGAAHPARGLGLRA